MNPRLFARESAVMVLVVAVLDAFKDKEGYFYKLDGNNQAIAIAAATDVPAGLVLLTREDGLEISGAPLGANHPPVKVKLGADVTDLRIDLVLRADGSVGPDPGAGARVIVARPLETGTTGELIEAALLKPRNLTTVLTSQTTAAASDLATSEALANALKADLGALRAAGLI
jgi:hypothetical protein